MTKKIKKPVAPITPKKTGKLHVKPTQEELDANVMKALEEARVIKEKEKTKPKEQPKPQPKEQPIKKTEKKEDPQPKPQPKEQPKPQPKEPESDLKKRYIASTKEAQILHTRNKVITESIEKAMNVPEPTEEELKAEHSEWEMMSDFEKKMARDSLRSTRRFQALDSISKENKSLDVWQKKVDKFIDNPETLIKNPELEGKEDEFKLFATKPTRRSLDFSDLVKAFLYDATKTVKPKKKSSMFETGTGGPITKDKPKSDKMSFEDGQILRDRDFKRYSRLLKANKIEQVDL